MEFYLHMNNKHLNFYRKWLNIFLEPNENFLCVNQLLLLRKRQYSYHKTKKNDAFINLYKTCHNCLLYI